LKRKKKILISTHNEHAVKRDKVLPLALLLESKQFGDSILEAKKMLDKEPTVRQLISKIINQEKEENFFFHWNRWWWF